MKKKTEKKLGLSKIKIAGLTKSNQKVVMGGYYSKISICPMNPCNRN